ncbi:hypothetical protein [Serratia ficaria]|uniref:hypothetical protein n=1 Tax=Serratia ficaria TaxID=61651 RepID=UPI0021B82A23|nr:hypothetical protein [Serratia ficaria]
MSKETGGPAFPREDYQANGHERGFEKLGQEGMSLRDYFAAQALSTASAYLEEDVATWSCDDFANHAYGIADAMLKARNQ